ncbi:XRE family transcriptional regulator [Periweissella fabaria]|uniref:HTH cro/C1-type domain-containing protein n=1 Tax=Periweissella fabaria TaxID=546157 RepID=A0ABN8BIB6_9LACO|nr:XRE family transcriptional regulator [Periweissella fabaria]MCM0596247.1 XRE family transcriptional regulator [Periweissella fabaria]CAH0417501.1 hypothetical protein WFA24289_01843 [Periweissella fabaria]
MIYENIKHFARMQGKSIRKIEQQAELSNGSIGKWDYNKPDVYKIRKVAALLDVTIDDLLKRK